MNRYVPKIQLVWRVRKQKKCNTNALVKRFSYHPRIDYIGPVEHPVQYTLFSSWTAARRSGINIRTSHSGPTGRTFPLAQFQKNEQTARIAKSWQRMEKERLK